MFSFVIIIINKKIWRFYFLSFEAPNALKDKIWLKVTSGK